MNKNTAILAAVTVMNSVIWLAVSAAIIAAVVATGRLSVFLWYLIPLCGNWGIQEVTK
jgi:uncharacterized protein (DUF2336 family)